jgi:ACS family hexuronate transporter-like MFS transporter
VAGTGPALALVCLALFAQQSWGANIHTVISEVAPPRHVAVLYGLTGAFGTLMGVIAQFCVGRLVDTAGYGPVFAGSALAFALSATLVLGAGRIERIRASHPLRSAAGRNG